MPAKAVPLKTFGAEITGVDISQPLSAADSATMRDAFREHGLIVFRDQQLDEQAHIAFAESWGQVNVNRFFDAHKIHPKIALVIKEPQQTNNIGGNWHTDHSYDLEPALGSILVARELPPVGGSTSFSSMYLAYDALPEDLRQRVEGLSALHSARHVFGAKAIAAFLGVEKWEDPDGKAALADQMDDVVHPVVIRHPISGRKALYVNSSFTRRILGVSAEESRDLLNRLYDHGGREDFVEKFEWRPGSVAMWDNRATWHMAANDYQGHRREMHRITIEGEAIEGSRLAAAAEIAEPVLA